jgi:hypothetical protein
MKTALKFALSALSLALVACGSQNNGSSTQAPANKPAKPVALAPKPAHFNAPDAIQKNCPNALGKQTSDPYKPRWLTLCEWIYADDTTPNENLTIARMIESAPDYGNTGDGSMKNVIRVLETADSFGFESEAISEVGPIATLPNLEIFSATGNFIHDLRPLRHLRKLSWITIGSNSPKIQPAFVECPIKGRPGSFCDMD